MKKVPNLRFKEFSGEWEQTTLGKVTNGFEYGMNAAATEFDGENKYIRITDIDEITNKYLDNDVVSPSGILEDKYLVNDNDILFARTGASTGKTYLYNKEDGRLYFAGFLIRSNVNSLNNSKFIFLQTQNQEYKKWVKVTSMRSGQPGINSQEYASYSFYSPKLGEQEKIAAFFSLIDKKIALQTEKVEELKNYKKGLMQKIFSQELRFKDENGNEYPEWEEYKVKDLFDVTRGVVIAKSEISDTSNDIFKYAVYSSQTSNNGILGYDQTFDFDGNYLTWTTDGANAGRVFCRSGRFRCTNVCGVLVEKNNTIGYANKLVAEILNKETPKHVSYVGNPKLMNGVMAEIKLNIPSLEEQTKIDKLINQLDIKIESEQTKLNLLDDYKKGLLQQMFI